MTVHAVCSDENEYEEEDEDEGDEVGDELSLDGDVGEEGLDALEPGDELPSSSSPKNSEVGEPQPK